jgi:uncharacterized protein
VSPEHRPAEPGHNQEQAAMKNLPAYLFAAIALVGVAVPALAEQKFHHVAIQVDENDPARMNLALNNAANLVKYYESKGETVEVRIVAYGPGLNMLRKDTSPVAARIASIAKNDPQVSFAACHNTMMGMQKKEGHPIELLPQATVVPSGVVELTRLQEQGWSYVRP